MDVKLGLLSYNWIYFWSAISIYQWTILEPYPPVLSGYRRFRENDSVYDRSFGGRNNFVSGVLHRTNKRSASWWILDGQTDDFLWISSYLFYLYFSICTWVCMDCILRMLLKTSLTSAKPRIHHSSWYIQDLQTISL